MTEQFFEWVRDHAADDPSALRLKYHDRRSDGIDCAAAIVQIECRRKFAAKLAATLEAFPDFYFPSVLAGEQASSDLLAAYHADLVDEGEAVADLTAGLGIDAFHIARRAATVAAVELDRARADALHFNARGLGLENVEIVEGDCADFIARVKTEGRRFGTIFIDPARRSATGDRVYALADCSPDVTAMMPEIACIAKQLIIKASPMLDVAHTIEHLNPMPCRITALGTQAECKELVVTVRFGADVAEPTLIEAVTLHPDSTRDTFAFTREEEAAAPLPSVDTAVRPGHYVYEPAPALMKTGAFRLLAARYGLSIFHPNTRLFHSAEPVDAFPGRRYKVLDALPYASKVIKRLKNRWPAAEVAVRNFGMSAEALRAHLGVKESSALRIYGITVGNERLLLVCDK